MIHLKKLSEPKRRKPMRQMFVIVGFALVLIFVYGKFFRKIQSIVTDVKSVTKEKSVMKEPPTLDSLLPNRQTELASGGTPTNNYVCDLLIARNNNNPYQQYQQYQYPSASSVWHRFRGTILKASYFPGETLTNNDINMTTTYRNWIDDLFEFHTESRLRKSRTYPPDPRTIRKIRNIMDRRLQYVVVRNKKEQKADGDNDSTNNTTTNTTTDNDNNNNNNNNNKNDNDNYIEAVEDKEEPEPLRIAVMGGSVTEGVNCHLTPLDTRGYPTRGMNGCAWASKLERLFNEVLFEGLDVVRITNMGAGGMSSEIGALVMEYQLFPVDKDKKLQLPHVILSSYAANDAQQPDLDRVFFVEVQEFIQLAKNVRPCDDDLPLVVLADHIYGKFKSGSSLTIQHILSGYYATLAAWHDVMALNHANVVRHEVIGNYQNDTAIMQLMGSNYDLHMGAGFHIGMAWTVFFNFLESFVDSCNDDATAAAATAAASTEGLSSRNDDSPIASANASATANGRIAIESLLKSPSVKQTSKLEGHGSVSDVVKRWKQRDEDAKSRCAVMMLEGSTSSSVSSPNMNSNTNSNALLVCQYAWVVGKGTGFNTVGLLSPKIDSVLQSSDGWKITGRPVQQPRTGWYAKQANATFAIRLPIVQIPVRFLTIVSMKSYGPNWIGSKLEVKATILRAAAASATTTNNTTTAAAATGITTHHLLSEEDVSTFEINGYHEIKTSVHFPHKFQLPGNGASIGDVVVVEARLVGGSTFKINGIAFCRV